MLTALDLLLPRCIGAGGRAMPFRDITEPEELVD